MYLYNLLGGELNYPVRNFALDIAFPEEKIYIEYDGQGHDLSVKLGQLTQKEFNKNMLNRYFILKSLGWKQIVINSPNDLLPSDGIIINMIKSTKEFLISKTCDVSHYIIDIGIEPVHHIYGQLRKIKKLPQVI